MLAERTEYDVVVMGGGLAGLTLALQILRRRPQTSVLVAERAEHPVPEAAHKVGEATVEVSAYYYANVLGLREHLDGDQLRKMGLRFYPAAEVPRPPLAQRAELGPEGYLALDTWQIDRGRFENALGEIVAEAGGEFISGCRVERFELDPSGHTVSLARGDDRCTVRARWALDASGRRGLIKNKLKLHQEVGHDCDAVWFRLGEMVWMDRLADAEDPPPQVAAAIAEWRERQPTGERWRSTNHLMGRGYWLWLIPLSSGSISIGLVFDHRHVPFEEVNSFEKILAWMEVNEPEVARAVEAKRESLQDFRVLKHFAHGCTQVFSPDRWALTGEAGVFTDPLYSPGGDFIAYSNSFITEMVTRELEGVPIGDYAMRADAVYRFMFHSFLFVWEGQYRIMGNPQVWGAKCIWDTFTYFSIMNQIFHNGKIADLDFLQLVVGEIFTFSILNHHMQMFLREWDRADPGIDQQHFFNLSSSIFYELNSSLLTHLDGEPLARRIGENLDFLRAAASVIMAGASRRIGVDARPEDIDPLTFRLGEPPARSEGPGLPGKQALDRALVALEGIWHEDRQADGVALVPRPAGTLAPAPGSSQRRRPTDMLANATAEVVARIPSGLLPLAARGPMRRVLLSAIFAMMARQIDPAKANGLQAVIGWEVDGNGHPPDRWQLVIDGGRGRAGRAGTAEPSVTMKLGAVELLKLATGLRNAPDMLIRGELQMDGDMMMGPRFLEVVRIPQPSGARAAASR